MTDTSLKANCQLFQILEHLTAHGSITPLEALSQYGCMRLGARVWDLRQRGLDIQTHKVKFTNQNGHAGQYAKYVLTGSEN